MAEECHQLNHHHEEGEKKSQYEESTIKIKADDEAFGEVEAKNRGLFDFMGKKKEEEIKKPEYGEEEVTVTEFEKVKVSEPEREVEGKKSDEYDESAIKAHDEVAGEVEAKGRGLFDFLGKKKEEDIKKPVYGEEEVLVTEFEKVKVSEPEPEPKVEERKEEEKKPSLFEKLKQSDDGSSSSSDEEEGEEGEKKKKKKGLTEKIKEKISGEKKEEEEEEEVKIEKQDYAQDSYIPIEKYDDVEATAPPAEEKKGFLEKIKEKLPGQTKKTEEAPPPSPPVVEYPEGEVKEKKGIIEKIKEKIPGYHPKTEEEKEKEKEKECA